MILTPKTKMKNYPTKRTFSVLFHLFLTLLSFAFINNIQAATFNTTATGGNWNTNGTWTGNAVPSNWGNHTANIYGTVAAPSIIQGFTLITLNNGKSFTSGTSSAAQSLTLQNIINFNVISGDITVYGDLTLQSTTITITSGSLTVTGTLTISNSSTINFNSNGILKAGSISTSGSTNVLNMNSGSLNVTNTLSIGSNSTVNVASGSTASVGILSTANDAQAILNNYGTFTANSVAMAGPINNYGTMNITTTLVGSGGGNSKFTNSGKLTVGGNVSLPNSSKLYVNPGAQAYLNGNVDLGTNNNLVIGTAAAGPPYADVVIQKNLNLTGGGDLTVEQNGRLAVFGNVSDNGGNGSNLTINSGGQVYIASNTAFSGNGSKITNNNSSTPNKYGLYTDGTISASGSATATTNYGNSTYMYNTNKPFYDWVGSLSGSPLPVVLVFFKTDEISSQAIVLSWATSSEWNFDKFVIERSADGHNYQALGALNGAGQSTSRLNYTFVDEHPLTGYSYYRLRMVDLNGTFEYSDIVSASLGSGTSGIRLYPNPVINKNFTIELNDQISMPAIIRVENATGYIIYKTQTDGNKTLVELPVDVVPGVYLVYINSEKAQHITRVVVQ